MKFETTAALALALTATSAMAQANTYDSSKYIELHLILGQGKTRDARIIVFNHGTDEHQTTCATVLMIDISHSMILYGEDRITPAKQVALALSELIMTRFPKDYIALITFGDDAQLVSINELPFLTVGPYHTNTRAGLQLARDLLRRRGGNVNKQIFMVTDGKPSAIFEPSGRLYKNSFGLDPKIVNKTLDEAVACRRERIPITTFMVARDPYLVNFVEELTKANHGWAYYSSLNNLGGFVFVDYIRNRRKKFSR